MALGVHGVIGLNVVPLVIMVRAQEVEFAARLSAVVRLVMALQIKLRCVS